MGTPAWTKAAEVSDTEDPKKVFSFIMEALLKSNCDRAAIILFGLEFVRREQAALETHAFVTFAEEMKDEHP